MSNDKPPCNRCKSRGLACTVNKSLQMLLENDVSYVFLMSASYVEILIKTTRWKEKMEGRMSRLEQSIIQSTNPSPRVTTGNAVLYQQPLSLDNGETERVNIQPYPRSGINSDMVTLNLSCSLGAFPASSMVSLALSDMTTSAGRTPDPISRGLLSQDTAENMLVYYKKNLDPCVHHILDENDTLSKIRTQSPILITAITTVVAFCNGSQNYTPLLECFKNQISAKMFSNNHSFDDIRALCVGALWLNEVSTAVNSLGEYPKLSRYQDSYLTRTKSCPHSHRTRSTQMHNQNATHKTRLLRSYQTLLARLHLRPPLLSNPRPTTPNTRLPITTPTTRFPSELFHNPIRSHHDQSGRAMVYQQPSLRHVWCRY
jgi:hypothetical protein